MSGPFILALDQGTTSSRAIVYGPDFVPVASAQREFRQHYPEPGWVEHDPEELWRSQRDVAAEAIARAGLQDRDIAAVGITNQRETTIVWDRATGAPVGNAIVWQDRRTAAACAALRQQPVGERIQERTGLCLDPYFSATKLAWILDRDAGLRRRAERGELCFGTVDSWLVYRLSAGKVHATDASNASRTMLFDLRRGTFDDELLDAFGVPRAMMPEVVDSCGVVAHVADGLPGAGAPIAGIAGDQQAALYGQGCRRPGAAKNTYGTGCFLLMHTGEQAVASQNRLLTTVAWRIGGRLEYALEGGVFMGGAVVQWLRDELRLIQSARECDELAASVSDSGGVVLVPAFAGLGAPHWQAGARGSILGLSRGSSRAHLCRAALEGIALQVADLVQCMERDSGLQLAELRVDGGAARSQLLLQIQASLLARPVVRPADVESTARGAAMLAARGVGLVDDGAATAGGDAIRVLPSAELDAARLRESWRRAIAATTAFSS